MKSLILVRGLPGSGKSEFASLFAGPVYSADMYFEKNGEYIFSIDQLPEAHMHCYNLVHRAMYNGDDKVVVANTFCQEWEMDCYFKLASAFDYRVYTVIVENRHGSENAHDVPDSIVNEMRRIFDITL